MIELLVVIAIVAVLLSLLLSAISMAMASAHSANCKTNLRELGHAFHLYATAWQGYIPHEDGGDTRPPFDQCWFDLLDPYIGREDAELKQCPSRIEDHRYRTFKMNSLLEDSMLPFYRIDRARRPSKTILLFDGRTNNSGTRYQTKGTWRSASAPHRGSTNLLFLDGHVSNHPAGETDSGWDSAGPFIWDPDGT